jgi:DNA-binding SARP family transcriptional activator
VVQAGAGFGKTTLLAQALAHNRHHPQGVDVWLGCEPADESAEHLRGGLVGSLALAAGHEDPHGEVVDLAWSFAPSEVALVLDDLHLVPADSPGESLLVRLVEDLPANAHLVVGSRREPPFPVARLLAAGDAALVTEADLAFDPDEVLAFAAARGLDPADVERTGGWPALAELRSMAGGGIDDAFLWEEVLRPLPEEQRDALAQLAPFGSFDDELVAVVTGRRRRAVDLVRGVPLASEEDGVVRLHDLWRPTPTGPAPASLEAGVELLERRGQFREAFDVIAQWGDDEAVERFLDRLVTRYFLDLPTDDFASILRRLPPALADRPAVDLMRAATLLGADGVAARRELDRAAERFAAAGDREGEAVALTRKLFVLFWQVDLPAMGAAISRLSELAAEGVDRARAMVDLSRAWGRLTAGAPQEAVDLLAGADGWGPTGGFLLAAARLDLGQPEQALREVDQVFDRSSGRLRIALEGAGLEARYLAGRYDEEGLAERRADVVRRTRSFAVAENVVLGTAAFAMGEAHTGTRALGQELLAEARALAPSAVGHRARAALGVAEASMALLDGDEAGAAAQLAATVEAAPIGARPDRAYLRALPSVYVLVPATREAIDAAELEGVWARAREIAHAVVAVRSGRPHGAAALPWDGLPALRAVTNPLFVVDLAVGAVELGVTEARAGLDHPAFDVRARLRVLADGDGPLAGTARRLLRVVAARPRHAVAIEALGSLALRRDGRPVEEPAWSRERVRALLALLVHFRRLSRARLAGLLWPDLEPAAAQNNLRVNLAHLRRLLQPDRGRDEPPWYVRADGSDLVLAPSDLLTVDVDRFEAAVLSGRAEEAQARPGEALRWYREATARYGGDYLAELDPEWADFERVRLRGLFVTAAVRAGELLLADGDRHEALRLAGLAAEAEPFAEPAHRLQAHALHAEGDRAGAWRLLSAAVDRLRAEGLEPTPETLRLRDLVAATA